MIITYLISHNQLYCVHKIIDGKEDVQSMRFFRSYGEARTYALDRVGQDESRVKVDWRVE